MLLLAVATTHADERPHRVIVKFGSICCGPDFSAMNRVSEVVTNHEQTSGRPIKKTWVPWGMEGDTTLCLGLEEYSASEQADLIGHVRKALEKSVGTKLEENVPCRGGWS